MGAYCAGTQVSDSNSIDNAERQAPDDRLKNRAERVRKEMVYIPGERVMLAPN